ncbi:MAG: hypothetical protein EHM55_04475 [Acidobacteria bacterium]|nr:MAG: hypothetical protein EHM55_04475 [Acidobacteriota bacterium]
MVHIPSLSPKIGDVILRRTNDASYRYTLTTTGEAPQIACATFEEAIARADAFAQSHNVEVWHTDDGHVFTRLVERRAVSST